MFLTYIFLFNKWFKKSNKKNHTLHPKLKAASFKAMAKRLFVLSKTHLYLGEEAVVKTFASCWSQPSVHCPSRLIQRSQMFIAP